MSEAQCLNCPEVFETEGEWDEETKTMVSTPIIPYKTGTDEGYCSASCRNEGIYKGLSDTDKRQVELLYRLSRALGKLELSASAKDAVVEMSDDIDNPLTDAQSHAGDLAATLNANEEVIWSKVIDASGTRIVCSDDLVMAALQLHMMSGREKAQARLDEAAANRETDESSKALKMIWAKDAADRAASCINWANKLTNSPEVW